MINQSIIKGLAEYLGRGEGKGRVGSKSSSRRGCSGVDRNSFIGNLSNISIDIISSVGHMLGPAIRKRHRVGSGPAVVSISSLFSLVVGSRVVVSNSIAVGEGFFSVQGRGEAGGSSQGIVDGIGSLEVLSLVDGIGSLEVLSLVDGIGSLEDAGRLEVLEEELGGSTSHNSR